MNDMREFYDRNMFKCSQTNALRIKLKTNLKQCSLTCLRVVW